MCGGGDTLAGLVRSGQGHVASFCESGDETSCSIKCVELNLCPEIFATLLRLFTSVKI